MMERWVIDAGMSEGLLLAFCPLSDTGEVIVGMTFLSDRPPDGGELVGVYHASGPEAADRWMKAHQEQLQEMVERQLGER